MVLTLVKTASFIPRFEEERSLRVILAIVLMACLAIMATVGDAYARPNSKYAGLVIDADTGTVLYEDRADATRYPASLTKMMTLYMTFEALRKGTLTLQKTIPVSRHAASMPQTNISLKKGDRISVQNAIISLVVRSANDAAVVLGEAIGGTESEFAQLMTNRARRLGMSKTTFRNASGLPDTGQVTTAQDMATLGLALRRDFPQYYHFFKRTQFTYNGRTYSGHNHVLKEMKGVDGIKTGYIRMSGFNLVSSISRDGYNLIGVVMGGRTSRSRDDHMKDILTRSLRKVASMHPPHAGRNMFAVNDDVPVPVAKPGSTALASAAPAAGGPPTNFQGRTPNATYGRNVARHGGDVSWGIQVGAFRESKEAFIAAVEAMNTASQELEGSQINVQDPENSRRGRIYRARIANITEAQARRACQVLQARDSECFVYRDSNS